MKARLFCKTGQLAGASFEIGADAMIGKSSDCAIQLYPQPISSRHARIYFDEKAQSYFLEDLTSLNGTKLDGARVKGKERLGSLHVITFANTFDFLFQVVDAQKQQTARSLNESIYDPVGSRRPKHAAKAEPQKTELGSGFIPQPPQPRTPELKPSPEVKTSEPKTVDPIMNVPSPQDTRQRTMFESDPFVVPSLREEQAKQNESRAGTKVSMDFTPEPSFVAPPPPSAAKLEITSFALVFDSTGTSFDLKEGSTILGRDASCGIRIEDGSVSRKHAEFTLSGGKLMLKDFGSKNHTYINEQKISYEVELREGMALTFGVVKARLVSKTR